MSCPTPTPALADVLEEPASDTSQLFQQVAFNHLLGLRRELAEGGVSKLVLDLREDLTNNFGNAHGGVLMTMLDGAMTSAAHFFCLNKASPRISVNRKPRRPAQELVRLLARAMSRAAAATARRRHQSQMPLMPRPPSARPSSTVIAWCTSPPSSPVCSG
ncbi:hypothetical protein D9M68_732010 [compost metagenome]